MSTNNMDRFEFRCIRPEETQQAIEIEQICFPPNEACSPKSLTERIKATAETFLVAEDKETWLHFLMEFLQMRRLSEMNSSQIFL